MPKGSKTPGSEGTAQYHVITDEEKRKMYDMVTIHGKTMTQVAKELGVDKGTVTRAMKKFSVLDENGRPVDTEDLVKLNRDVYRKINLLINGFTDLALEKSNVYQVAGAISMLTGVLKDLTKLTGDRLDEDLPEDIDIRGRVGRLETGLQKLSNLSGRFHQEKVRIAQREHTEAKEKA